MSQRHRITKSDECEHFRAFWSLWQPMARHTDGRGLARDEFYRHVDHGADPQDIVDGAAWFLRGVKDRQFVPLSATWLNRRAYEDMADLERSFRSRQQQPAENVTPIRRAKLPDNHFSRQWERRNASGE